MSAVREQGDKQAKRELNANFQKALGLRLDVPQNGNTNICIIYIYIYTYYIYTHTLQIRSGRIFLLFLC